MTILLSFNQTQIQETAVNKWPSILCAIHCALMPVLSVFVGATTLHHPIVEFIEYVLIAVVFFVLARTVYKLGRVQLALALMGILLMVSLLLALILLPHAFVSLCMVCIASFQIFTGRKLCGVCHTH